jgi:hypothetical protein
MKTIVLIGITAIALGLPGCSSDQRSGESSNAQPNTATTSDTQRGTLLQGSSYDTGNRSPQ